MTMHEEWTDKLSDYLDDELSAGDRDAVEAHLETCAHCAAVLDQLTRVVVRAQAVEPRPPQADLWTGIAARIEAEAERRPSQVTPFALRQARRVTFTISQLAAAAVILAAVSGGIAWEVRASLPGRPEGVRYDSAPSAGVAQALRPANPDGGNAGRDVAQGYNPASAGADVVRVGMADAQYDAAVADLENALTEGRGRLDASTIAIVEHNLQIIDQAINQAREALVADPANSYLSGHLVEARRRKLDLLRRATALTSETD
jgi:negative regulator of sigma E activity